MAAARRRYARKVLDRSNSASDGGATELRRLRLESERQEGLDIYRDDSESDDEESDDGRDLYRDESEEESDNGSELNRDESDDESDEGSAPGA